MNLMQASIIISNFHRAHPETKKLSPEQVEAFVLNLPAEEREPIENAKRVIRAEVREAVEFITDGKLKI